MQYSAAPACVSDACTVEDAPRWSIDSVLALYATPFNDLLFRAHQIHRAYFDPNAMQLSTLCSIKTGGCPEDCAYCPQSARYKTGLKADKLKPLPEVLEAARAAKAKGATDSAWMRPGAARSLSS